ncbi:MAG: protoporphyrinogen oxidase, partial [Acidimicrobiales bacterium]
PATAAGRAGAAGTGPTSGGPEDRRGWSGGPVVAVVGGGITGLAAALAVLDHPAPPGGPAPRVVLLEAGDRLGGKIRTEELGDRPVEAGPDAFLARVPHAVQLCRRVGLSGELVAPATGRARVWVNGRLRPLPEGLVLGVPTRFGPLARSGILSPQGLARAALDLVLPADPTAEDRSIGQLVRSRLGDEVHDRLAEPLLGGINAGRTDHLSAALAAPRLDAAARRSRSLVLALRAEQSRLGGGGAGAAGTAGAGPVFLAPRGGLGRLVEALARELAASGGRASVRTATPVTAVERSEGRWILATGSGPVAADAVVLALPAPDAAPLVAPHAPEAGRLMTGIGYASVSLATLTYPVSAVGQILDGSGYLVPPGDGRLTTACTWTSSKWPHLARPGEVLLRVSTGRWADDRPAQLDDEALVSAVHEELVEAMGISAPGPSTWRVARWPSSFPQYEVGHLDRVDRLESALGAAPGLVVAGASYRGIGIPSCIDQGQRAAGAALARLHLTVPGGGG